MNFYLKTDQNEVDIVYHVRRERYFVKGDTPVLKDDDVPGVLDIAADAAVVVDIDDTLVVVLDIDAVVAVDLDFRHDYLLLLNKHLPVHKHLHLDLLNLEDEKNPR